MREVQWNELLKGVKMRCGIEMLGINILVKQDVIVVAVGIVKDC
jgi:hypothetical protein